MTWRWAVHELFALTALSLVLPDTLGVAYVDARLRLIFAGVAGMVASSFVLQSGNRRQGVWAGMGAFVFLIAADMLRIGRASGWEFVGWTPGALAGLLLLAFGLTMTAAAGAAWAVLRWGRRLASGAVWLSHAVLYGALAFGAPAKVHYLLLSMTQPASGQFWVLLGVALLLLLASGAVAAQASALATGSRPASRTGTQ